MTSPGLWLSAALVAAVIAGPHLPAAEPVRQSWTTSQLHGGPDEPLPLRLEPAFPRLTFQDPMHVRWQPDLQRCFVCELGGKIWSFPDDPQVASADLAIDFKESLKSFDPERSSGCDSLYSLVFDPDFANNRFLYTCLILKSKTGQPLPDGSRISRFRVSKEQPPRIDVDSELPIITWLAGGHNGADLAFDSRGCLLISTGDATAPSPPDSLGTGQDISDLLSSVLRIDVRGATPEQPYTIPADNPFRLTPGARPEVWAYGFRNPWRISFDPPSGQLWVGDVGWEKWELIHRVERGGNYGWSVREGNELLQPDAPLGPTPILPTRVAISHSDAASITGGFVYRGQQLPQIAGQYLFGDWITGRIWSVPLDDFSPHREVASGQLRIIAFSPDRNGEPLVVNHLAGTTLFRLVANRDYDRQLEAARNFPRRLSQTGLLSDVREHKLETGVRPFTISQPQWADGATAVHAIALPEMAKVTVFDQPQPVGTIAMFNSRLHYPPGTVLLKTLTLPANGHRIETQLLVFDGRLWNAMTYLWNSEQSDAELAPAEGLEFELPGTAGQRWRVHSRSECLQCHNPWPETTLAFTPEQLHRPDLGARSEWLALARDGYVETLDRQRRPIEAERCVRRPLRTSDRESSEPDSANERGAQDRIAERARAYLHANCAHCHQNGAGAAVDLSLRMNDQVPAMKALGVPPAKGSFGLLDAKLIAPGDPAASVLLYRMASSSIGRMPHIGSREVDFHGVARVADWIESLNDSPPEGSSVAAAGRSQRIERLAANLVGPASGAPASSSDAAAAEARAQRMRTALQLAVELARARADSATTALPESAAQHTTQKSEAPLSEASLARLAAAADPLVSSLFEGFLPAGQRQRRLGPSATFADVAGLAGDAAAGEAWFFDASRSQCARCHRVGSRGIAVGPDLTDIGQRQTAAQLFEALADPSRVVAPKYQSHILVLADGKVVTGLLGKETDEELTLTNAQGERVTLAISDIDSRRPNPKSLMPEGLTSELTAQQLADLLAFLSSLGTQPAQAATQDDQTDPKASDPKAADPKAVGAEVNDSSNAASRLHVEQNDRTLTVLDNDQPILVYNKQSPAAPPGIDRVYERSGFLHPVFSPAGQTVTAAFPFDHPHQHGIFSAWVKTKFAGKPVDFWNLGGRTGRVLHQRVTSTFEKGSEAGFEVDLLHRVESDPPIDALGEHWKITVRRTDGSYRCFDLETTQTALTDQPLLVEQYHYGGVAVRGPIAWLSPRDSDIKAKAARAPAPEADASKSESPAETFAFLNSNGRDRLAGNHDHAHWVSMDGTLGGRPVSLTVLDHPTNFRAPQAARLHPTKPYFVYAPCVDGAFTIDRDHPYRARYRFIIRDAPADAAWLEARWREWAGQK